MLFDLQADASCSVGFTHGSTVWYYQELFYYFGDPLPHGAGDPSSTLTLDKVFVSVHYHSSFNIKKKKSK